MKKFFAAVLFSALFAPTATAGVPCTLPFTLTNGSTADATQVMANYNALVTCLTNAAHAGANADITSLTALSTPISPGQGGSLVFSGADSTGTANALVVSSTVPPGFTLTKGFGVLFKVGSGTNTGATTLNVSGLGALALTRPSSIGPIGLAGSELVNGEMVVVIYDGTQFQLVSASALFGYNIATRSDPGQVITGGAIVTTLTLSSSSQTIDCGQRPLQFISNIGSLTLSAPSNDGACDILVNNTGSAGTISFSGFTTGPNTGDALTATPGSNFIIHIERIAGIATWVNKALQ